MIRKSVVYIEQIETWLELVKRNYMNNHITILTVMDRTNIDFFNNK